MIPINIYPEEIQLLKEKEFYTDLKHLTSLYINADFKKLYYNVFSKIHPKNTLYQFSPQINPQRLNYDHFNELGHTIQTPSGYSFNFKYNVSLQKTKLSPHLHNNIDIHLYKIYSKSKKLIINNEDDVGNFPTFIHFFHYLIII
ncbi:conserved rodent malaria protein, unknown function [Plasmodium berghei]|uniref:Uncharacterized protein n=3 Tax=Plasmodium berghei TaxID=5821 RepID=A0A509ADW6_PLABA|nr:conserved rodent malaria protein, unknown function [Plasmodium berghei ANKA]SBW38070.1 conserved rodent malaria protein, unknown function [Plasmodium berghei]SCM17098.1 conserved rodent malaria protein, unknown function [Plasmodium berghei]VUC54025.1 conserved rodent malaria protein, unknown function [Plasmodium berghei ANKA]|eukprot:XP_034419876.1 conserved rodent malaria protein, unknown function [Plasmodium berghei ANKA]